MSKKDQRLRDEMYAEVPDRKSREEDLQKRGLDPLGNLSLKGVELLFSGRIATGKVANQGAS